MPSNAVTTSFKEDRLYQLFKVFSASCFFPSESNLIRSNLWYFYENLLLNRIFYALDHDKTCHSVRYFLSGMAVTFNAYELWEFEIFLFKTLPNLKMDEVFNIIQYNFESKPLCLVVYCKKKAEIIYNWTTRIH